MQSKNAFSPHTENTCTRSFLSTQLKITLSSLNDLTSHTHTHTRTRAHCSLKQATAHMHRSLKHATNGHTQSLNENKHTHKNAHTHIHAHAPQSMQLKTTHSPLSNEDMHTHIHTFMMHVMRDSGEELSLKSCKGAIVYPPRTCVCVLCVCVVCVYI
jgi:YesN/AraC family two-component response regulator